MCGKNKDTRAATAELISTLKVQAILFQGTLIVGLATSSVIVHGQISLIPVRTYYS